MFELQNGHLPSTTAFSSFALRMQRLGETFIVRDVMVPRGEIVAVPIGDAAGAAALVQSERFSVVPQVDGNSNFARVYCTIHPYDGERVINKERPTLVSDHIPDSTPLADAFLLFDEREWYFTLRGNQVSGLLTYWAFNRHEFRVQLFTMVSLIEGISRDILATDGCGTVDASGIKLGVQHLAEPIKRFEAAKQHGGGNRFVDELDFHQVHEALKVHEPWRAFLIKNQISNSQYEKHFSFTTFRNDIMHGRTMFPTFERFKKRRRAFARMVEWVDLLYAYQAEQN